MIPYSRQNIDDEDIKAVLKVLKSDFLTQGPVVKKFENKIIESLKCKHAIAVNSATSALHIACLALNVKKNDIVWTTPNSFVASANCALYCDANIDFVDIENKTWNMSIIELEKKLKIAKKNKKLPKVVIYVHLAGNPIDQKKIYNLSKLYNFKIIEDASHAFGAKYKKSYIGNCRWSDITVFSFHPVKIITTAEGGVATTNNKNYAEKMKLFASHGITKDKKNFLNKKPNPWHYEQHYLGYNYRMSEIHAALGLSQLKKFKNFVKKRNNLANLYKKNLNSLKITFQEIDKYNLSSYHLFIISFSYEDINLKVFKELKKNKFASNIHYQPIHLQPYFKKLGFKKGDFPIAEDFSKLCLSIPLSTSLNETDIIKISEIIKKIIK